MDEHVLENLDQSNVRDGERENEQAPSPIDPPPGDVLTSVVEYAPEEKKKLHVTQLREYREK